MKKNILILLVICVIALAGCGIKLPSKEENNTPKESAEIIAASKSIDGTFTIMANDTFLSSEDYSEELSDAYIILSNEYVFYAYLGFGNTVSGTYKVSNDVITCEMSSFANEYSPIQDISAFVSFKNNYDNTLTVIDASPSFHIKTTNMDENGIWVYDGGEKDMPLTVFTKGISYKLYELYNQ